MSNVDALMSRQNTLLVNVQKCLINFKKDGPSRRTEVYLRLRLEQLNNAASEFRSNDRELLLNNVPIDSDYVKNDCSEVFEEAYIEAVSEIETIRDTLFPRSLESPSSPGDISSSALRNSTMRGNSSSMPSRLQKLKVPLFDGKYRDWPPYRDIFVSLIHANDQLARVEKFHYLKDSLKDEPLQMVKHLTMTEENYNSAWTILNKHYENRRELFKDHMRLFASTKRIEAEDSKGIRSLLNVSREVRQALVGFEIDLKSADPILVFYIVEKLPPVTIGLYETKLGGSSTIPTFESLQNFLDTRIKTLEAIDESTKYDAASSKSRDSIKINKKNAFHVVKKSENASNHSKSSADKTTNKGSIVCCVCNGNHFLLKCSKFLSMATPARLAVVENKRICSNCLSPTHTVDTCHSKFNCRCGERHHSMLHTERSVTSLHSTTRVGEKEVLLSTAVVRVRTADGAWVEMRALIDSGSQASMITRNALSSLNLPALSIRATVTGISETPSDTCTELVQLQIGSRYDSECQLVVDAFVMRKLTGLLPNKNLIRRDWANLKQMPLADPEFCKPSRVDLVLGAEVYAQIITDGLMRDQSGLTAQNTRFGWILFGETTCHSSRSSNNQRDIQVNSFVTKIEIKALLERFWELESTPTERVLKPEDKWCENFYASTVRRNETGRYEVRLPFRTYTNSHVVIGKSRQIAIQQFVQLERRFAKNPQFHSEYKNCINEYFTSNQIELVRTTEDDHFTHNDGIPSFTCCYLTQHAVFKASSTSTKLRVVFNAARKTANRKSLNDILLPGPALQNDLPSVITNWRFHKVVANADIKQMFRQILVNYDDAQFQRIVWRNDPSEELREYYLKTVTFGTTSAPYLAIRTIIQLAHDNQNDYPELMNFLLKCIYVDDIFIGGDTIRFVQKIIDQMNSVFESAGFELRKWTSNNETILESIPSEIREIQLPLSLNENETVKTLGMYWLPIEDLFCFKLNFDNKIANDGMITKRMVLSTIARLFDPLGFITPFTLIAKIVLRKVWMEDLDWDKVIPEHLRSEWLEFTKNLEDLPQLRIPRWIGTFNTDTSFEIHAFCDASQYAYATAIYLRSSSDGIHYRSNLLISKTKIAPIKTTTIPRLELLGAQLLARLVAHVLKHLQLPVKRPTVQAWTDAEIVRFWLNGDPNRWDIFVSNRVIEISEIVKPEQWRHIDTDSNPADCATRGLWPCDLMNHTLWWKGPTFLHDARATWPLAKPIRDFTNVNSRKLVLEAHHAQIHVVNQSMLRVLNRFSRYDMLLRVTVLLMRFAEKTKTHRPITVIELNQARERWIRIVQRIEFPAEMRALERKEPLPSKSQLIKLVPFLDDHKIMRVHGRLEKSMLKFDEKHPIILPSKSHFTVLLIRDYHRLSLHGGTQLMLALLRKSFWILNARNTVRSIVWKCVTCHRFRAKMNSQQMGHLPAYRVRPSRCFHSTGVDYAGPINVRVAKVRGGATQKGYIAVFVCLSVKAIHLELVGDMTAESFIAALKRFCGRRGFPADMFSDCGTTFVGANNQMTSQRNAWMNQIETEVLPFLTTRGVQWHFIPPAAPHFGGLWEAGVKSMKHHLKRVCGEQTFTYEIWNTFLVQIEACLNSRPLCPMTADSDDLTPLTPGHFLTGDAILSLPEPNRENENIPATKKWNAITKMTQIFWRRWSNEWLNKLQSRPKWKNPEANSELNDLVLIKDERLPPTQWLLGRIVECHPGKDELVRVVSLRTKNGIIKRPITKISKLPIDSETPHLTETHRPNEHEEEREVIEIDVGLQS